MNLSTNVSYKEFVKSATAQRRGIKNSPSEEAYYNGVYLAKHVIQPTRDHFGLPIIINSFFRSIELNDVIGGSSTSQHCKGEAVDLDATVGYSNIDIFYYIYRNLEFDQLIWEFGDENEPDWVHVSIKSDVTIKLTGKKNRKRCLKAYKSPSKGTVYEEFEPK